MLNEYKYYHDRNTPKLDWNEKTEIRRKRRELDKANFKEVYKDVPFENSHVFGIIRGCRLYYPFQNEGVSAEIYIVQNNGNHAEKVPCKVGTPYPNKNSSLMESIMDNDSLFILYQNEDVIRPIKESEDDEVYTFIAQQALAHFSAKELMEMLSSDNSSLPVEVAVEKEDVLQGYYSSSWRKVKPRFEFKLFEK